MKTRDFFEMIGNGLMYVLAITNPKELFEIISLILSILISLIILISKIVNWWKSAKADGKITKEEIKELQDMTKEDVENLVDAIKKEEEHNGNKGD